MSDDLRENFRRYVNTSAEALARDLASLLNRAQGLGIAVCPDVDYEEGTSYSIEWCVGDMYHRDVEYDHATKQWAMKGCSDD